MLLRRIYQHPRVQRSKAYVVFIRLTLMNINIEFSFNVILFLIIFHSKVRWCETCEEKKKNYLFWRGIEENRRKKMIRSSFVVSHSSVPVCMLFSFHRNHEITTSDTKIAILNYIKQDITNKFFDNNLS